MEGYPAAHSRATNGLKTALAESPSFLPSFPLPVSQSFSENPFSPPPPSLSMLTHHLFHKPPLRQHHLLFSSRRRRSSSSSVSSSWVFNSSASRCWCWGAHSSAGVITIFCVPGKGGRGSRARACPSGPSGGIIDRKLSLINSVTRGVLLSCVHSVRLGELRPRCWAPWQQIVVWDLDVDV